MIQRIQTVYLFLAAAVAVVCLSLPIGVFVTQGVGLKMEMYNLIVVNNAALQQYDHSACALFFALLAAAAMSLMTIFKFNKRRVQARMCITANILIVAWYVLYAFFAYTLQSKYAAEFEIRWVVALPLVCFILNILARRAILKDEALVRAADRIR